MPRSEFTTWENAWLVSNGIPSLRGNRTHLLGLGKWENILSYNSIHKCRKCAFDAAEIEVTLLLYVMDSGFSAIYFCLTSRYIPLVEI